MSEYQYYEFLAIDRPLTADEQQEVRSLSTRARISATSFVNEYHWGDFHGDPNRLMQRYYDAHLYWANWGRRRVMFRLPCELLGPGIVEEYCTDDQAVASVSGEFTVFDFTSEDEPGEDEFDADAAALLATIAGVRAELVAGDLRPLYLAWLAGCSIWDLDGDVFGDSLEPPVPPGLGSLTAAQRELAEFLRVDQDLLAVAALTSLPLKVAGSDRRALSEWVKRLPEAEKNGYLLRLVQGEAARVSAELQREYRDASVADTPAPNRRKVATLFEETAKRRDEAARRRAAARAEAEVRREQQRAQARERRPNTLASEGDAAWSRVDALIATRKPTEYDAAVTLLTDLQVIAERQGRLEIFTKRSSAVRHVHARKVSLIERLDRAGI